MSEIGMGHLQFKSGLLVHESPNLDTGTPHLAAESQNRHGSFAI